MSTEFDPNASNNAGRAFRIRKREKTRRTPDDLAFLTAYEAHLEAKAKAREEQASAAPAPAPIDSPAPPATPDPVAEVAQTSEPSITPSKQDNVAPAGEPIPDPKSETPKPPIPKPPRTAPPKVESPPKARAEAVDAEVMPKRGASRDWRDKYKPKSEDGATAEPREVVCIEVAKLGLAILNWMADGIRSIDKKPVVEPQQLGGSLVLLADQLLPGVAELTPEKMVIAGAAALAGQRLVLHSKIAAKARQTAETSKHKSKMDDMRKTAEANHHERAAKQSANASVPAILHGNDSGTNGHAHASERGTDDPGTNLREVETLAEHMNGSDWQPMPGDVW